MENLLNSYLQYLATHPDVINSIIVWNTIMAFFYFIMLKYREKMIAGAHGKNASWESPEQYSYVGKWVVFPIVTFSASFRYDLPTYMWYFVYGLTAYVIGGRWIFEWALALRAGSTKVEHDADGNSKEEVK